MKQYCMMKNFDLVSEKNTQENETRNETTGTQYFDINFVSIRSIHIKKNEFK